MGKETLFLTTAPHTINWNFTYKCNLNCKHCYSRNRDRINEMNLEEKKKAALNIVKGNVFLVNLGGGEPICSEDVYEIIKIFSDNGVYISLSTNGHFINEKVVKKLKEVDLTAACVSLDHIIPEIHNEGRGYQNSYDEAINAIKLFVENKIKVVVSTVITSKNIYALEEIIKYLIELKCETISLRRLKMQGNALLNKNLQLSEEEEEKLYEKMRELKEKYSKNIVIDFVYGANPVENIDKGCSCGRTSVGITPVGDIIPCVYNEKLIIGNILEDNLEEIWQNSEKLNYLRNNFKCLGLMLEVGKYRINPKFKIQYSLEYKSIVDFVKINFDDIYSIAYYNKKQYKFNFIATKIIESLMAGCNIKEIIENIKKEKIEIMEEVIIEDVIKFLYNLEKKGIVIHTYD